MADNEPALAAYEAKRDFARTPEPAPRPARPSGAGGGGRFVVQRHRARRLHYDFRLEIDGVLVSWAVPKGPTLDPAARHLAVHVEDHPIEYIDFEGVIPAGEYGGGDVIVWDRGTWEPHGTDDPAQAVADGDLHVDLHGEKLQGRFVLVRGGRGRRKGGGSSGKDEWLLLHKRDDFAVEGWDPEDHPRSVRSGRTNDEVAADPDAQWFSDRPANLAALDFSPDRDDIAALDRLGPNGGRWDFDGVTLRLTNLDKVLFPARPGPGRRKGRPLTKRDLIRWYATVAPVLVPYLSGRAVNLHRFPNGVEAKGFWHKEIPNHAPDWISRWHCDSGGSRPRRRPAAGSPTPRRGPQPRRQASGLIVVDRPATLAWLGNFGAVELHPWTSPTTAPDQPSYALIDIDPGPDTAWDDTLVLARLYRTALEHLGITGCPKVSGQRGIQVWVPVAGCTFAETRAWVEKVSRTVGRVVPELVSWEWHKANRSGRARLDYTQNAVNKTLVAPYSVRAAPGAPVSMPITWDELDDADLRPDRWTILDAPARLLERGDLFTPVLHPSPGPLPDL
ncbi:MAG: DNA polymerase ligase N-terminal domain-containing protein [Acidimicrobiales bacterium]